MNVLVTGASGFVGRRLCHVLSDNGATLRASTRKDIGKTTDVFIPDISGVTDWSVALSGITHVVHLAAKVHVISEGADGGVASYTAVNTEGTANLAEQAASSGVRRFVYMSTVKVHGETTNGSPFREADDPNPHGYYAISKFEAERRLRDIEARTGLEVVTIRPPLVYGPGVKGNMKRLLRWIELGIPLPFANVANQRSLIGLENLVAFIRLCLAHPKASGETFLVSDGKDLSTRDLVCGLASAMGRRCRLMPVPKKLVRSLMRFSGKEVLWSRLWSSLQVDTTKACRLLDWSPPQTTEAALEQLAEWYVAQKSHHS